ncbi:glycosyltransferase family 4 protein [Temperatibacter marinus]|uniref:Glycosyltransferase family 4 protein n=1 Tax=Temperatibacter marinus TaxID=1456591 RepID=A0AA52EHI9_9PROT|nr:glycosyltransferase family 4 protein [Temperatibacter marinus]WND03273.1 glycosyltransferase family 4 protein [Temperatibacter marinus]
MAKSMNILAIAPYIDGTDVGEAWCAYRWIKELSTRGNVTLLAMEREGRKALSVQLPNVRVLSKKEPKWVQRYERLNAMAKLAYPGFYFWAKKQIKELLKTETFDVGHQFSPFAIRYPSPLKAFSIPYVLGPFCGSLDTPKNFRKECMSSKWFTHFRALDQFRLNFDPFMRASLKGASAILGVAPYVKTMLGDTALKKFHLMSELGVSKTSTRFTSSHSQKKSFRLLHVGRGVRTKGLRDVIRALSLLQDLKCLHLDVAGHGEETEICRQLSITLGVQDRITFHGQISRREVDQLYCQADAFCFPSFREPSGSVIFEALSYGLPIIAANYGGPGHVIDDTCGFKIHVTDPDQYAADIASAIRTLVSMPMLNKQLSKGAYAKINKIGLWKNKIDTLLNIYENIQLPKGDHYVKISD